GEQVFALGHGQIGAVDGKERLSLLHVLIRGIRKDVLNVTREAYLDVRHTSLIHRDISGRKELSLDRFAHDHAGRYADLLKPLGRDLQRRQRRLCLSGRRRRAGGVGHGCAICSRRWISGSTWLARERGHEQSHCERQPKCAWMIVHGFTPVSVAPAVALGSTCDAVSTPPPLARSSSASRSKYS